MLYTTLNNGIKMPLLGFGVYKLAEGEACMNAVKCAIEAGYRSIDTAALYENEKSVGQAIRTCGIPREEIFLTTKLGNPDQMNGNIMEAFDASLSKLGLDYVDLYLVHWPCAPYHISSWPIMEKILQSGKARAIGVSNYQPHHLDDIAQTSTVTPALNQIEMHPFFTQQSLRAYCRTHHIAPQSWSPLGGERPVQEQLFAAPAITRLAAKYNKTPAQIILRWNIEHGVITIPKSANSARIAENIDIFDFALTVDEVAAIDALNRDQRVGPDPDTHR
ncbi:MAG: aldo/keto reductase [Defluviitaleaceae bacterium]|nr:aldo/keto reductase [Defluviitaleaceae bacterium]